MSNRPAACELCGMPVGSEAEAYLHRAVHGSPDGLARLPYALFPAVAKVMEQYRASAVNPAKSVPQSEGAE